MNAEVVDWADVLVNFLNEVVGVVAVKEVDDETMEVVGVSVLLGNDVVFVYRVGDGFVIDGVGNFGCIECIMAYFMKEVEDDG